MGFQSDIEVGKSVTRRDKRVKNVTADSVSISAIVKKEKLADVNKL